MLMKTNKKLAKDSRGFASLVIALVLVLVLSLVTVGFAQLMRHESRSALDKQLESQAYYAAESGINDAAKAISAGYAESKTTCGPDMSIAPGASYLNSNQVGSGTGASYPCLLIDPTPSSLEYGSIDTDQPKSIEVTGVGSGGTPANITSMTISWQDTGNNKNFAPASQNNFPPASGWNHPGILRVALTPLVTGGISRDNLAKSTYTAFLYPNGGSGGGSDSYATSISSGRIVNGGCNTSNTPHDCVVKITGLGASDYLLDLRSIYKNVQVNITVNGTNNQTLSIKNAQTLIDSTGKAQDVLKRLQVRIPSHNNYNYPTGGVETGASICKELQVYPSNPFLRSGSGCTTTP